MANPSQMFDHTLDAVKGWFHEAALDYSAKLSSNVLKDPTEQGSVVHVNSSGEFELGIANTDMAIFLLNSSDDFDVANAGGDYWTAVAPTGKMSGLVATGAYELQSSEFDGTPTYAPNDLLCSDDVQTLAGDGGALDNRDDADAALNVPWATGTDQAICGVVSSGESTNSHGIAVISFWPVYLPGES
jgi:hypothetical protein